LNAFLNGYMFVSVESAVPTVPTEEDNSLSTELIIIIAISAAGVLLILVLGTCNCIRTRKNSKGVSQGHAIKA
jgi:hypothetical protein